jgi:preprotein translocase subunit YajC
MSGGRVGVVAEIEDCFVTIKFRDTPKGEPQQFTKSSIRRVLQPPLSVDSRVLTKLGLVGTITAYSQESRIVKIKVFDKEVEIDKCLICEVLPDPPSPPPAKPAKGIG